MKEWIKDNIGDDLFFFGCLIIAIYAFVLLIRIIGVYKKGKCPTCSGKLIRTNRLFPDRLKKWLTLGILPFRRYTCVHCGWEGVRWNNKSAHKKASY